MEVQEAPAGEEGQRRRESVDLAGKKGLIELALSRFLGPAAARGCLSAGEGRL